MAVGKAPYGPQTSPPPDCAKGCRRRGHFVPCFVALLCWFNCFVDQVLPLTTDLLHCSEKVCLTSFWFICTKPPNEKTFFGKAERPTQLKSWPSWVFDWKGSREESECESRSALQRPWRNFQSTVQILHDPRSQ